MGPGEHGDVHGDPQRVRLVQANAEVPLPAQQQEDEHADVHEAQASCGHKQWSLGPLDPAPLPQGPGLTLVGSGVVEVEEDGHQHVQHVAALQHEEEEFLKGTQTASVCRVLLRTESPTGPWRTKLTDSL